MIKLEVLDCPNSDYLGEYTFYKNLLYVGSSIDADLCVEDLKVKSLHLIIEVVEEQLLAHLGKTAEVFWVNGKRSGKLKFLASGDELTLGETTLKVVSFAQTKIETKRDALNKNTEELIRDKSPLLAYIKELQKSL